MLSERICVFMHGKLAAYIVRDGLEEGVLRYCDEYRLDPSAVPLSMSLPLGIQQHGRDATLRWVDGLLPDNPRVMARWCANEGVSAATPLGLLSTRVGLDCAGAVQFVPEGSEAEVTSRSGSLKMLSYSEVCAEVHQMASDLSYWLPDEQEAYFSLGGYQAKTAFHRLSDGTWARPVGSIPTTHILKPSPVTQPHLAVVEHLCSDIARRLGLNAAKTALEEYDGLGVCVVERYDRNKGDDGWLRIHQEDVCQALGVHAYQKYEARGGPGIAKLGDLLYRESTHPDQDVKALQDALLYYWLIVNRDAHARNYSLLIEPSHVRLAPMYDISSVLPTAAKKIGSYEIAMRFARDFTVYRSQAADSLATLSAYLRVDHDFTLLRAEELSAEIVDCAETAMSALPTAYQTPPLEMMLKRLQQRSEECLKTIQAAHRRLQSHQQPL